MLMSLEKKRIENTKTEQNEAVKGCLSVLGEIPKKAPKLKKE